MSTLQTFRLFDAFGAPLTGATPTFRVYVNGAGTPVSAPAIFEIGLGKYGFLYDTTTLARAYQIDGGASAVPRYLSGGNAEDVQAFGVYTNLGAPGAPGGGSPNFLQYVDSGGSPQSQPSFLNPAVGFYFFLPSAGDVSAGRSYVIRSDSGGVLLPTQYDGTVGLLPGAGGALVVVSVVPAAFSITVNLSATSVLTGDSLDPAEWQVGGGGVPVVVTAVQIAGAAITLTTNEATSGASYTLFIPQGIVDSGSGNPCTGAFVQPFTGVGAAPTAFMAQPIDARHVRVIFNEPVQAADATQVSNYSITSPNLAVLSVVQETERNYVLETAPATPGVLYTIVITNVRDLAGNPV